MWLLCSHHGHCRRRCTQRLRPPRWQGGAWLLHCKPRNLHHGIFGRVPMPPRASHQGQGQQPAVARSATTCWPSASPRWTKRSCELGLDSPRLVAAVLEARQACPSPAVTRSRHPQPCLHLQALQGGTGEPPLACGQHQARARAEREVLGQRMRRRRRRRAGCPLAAALDAAARAGGAQP